MSGLRPLKLIYYVSPHGYGHARRTREILRQLLAMNPAMTVEVRTEASAAVFAGLDPRMSLTRVDVDTGVVEHDALSIDWDATMHRLHAGQSRQPQRLSREARHAKRIGASALISDISPLAGHVARAVGIPAIAIGNFTWDWIYEAHLPGDSDLARVLEWVREGYRGMDCLLRLPFGHDQPLFGLVRDMPLVSIPVEMPADAMREALGIARGDSRPLVLVALRGMEMSTAIVAAATASPGLWFASVGAAPPGSPANVIDASAWAGTRFQSLLNACDVVVSKLGHGIVTDCIACRKRLLWPQRRGFREDELLASAVRRHVPQRELPREMLPGGAWGELAQSLLAAPWPDIATPACNGAEVIAREIAGWIDPPCRIAGGSARV